MTRFWKRGRDHDVEARLRAARSNPPPQLTRAIGEQVRPRRAVAGRRRPLGVAGLVTALVLVPVIALGGGSAAIGAVSDQLNLRPAKNQIIAAPALVQYGGSVQTCVLGRLQVRLPPRVAALLVRLNLAKLGSCSPTVTRRAAALKKKPLARICVLQELQTNLPRTLAKRLIRLGVARTRPCNATPS